MGAECSILFMVAEQKSRLGRKAGRHKQTPGAAGGTRVQEGDEPASVFIIELLILQTNREFKYIK